MLSSYEFLKLLQTCIAFSALMLFVGQKEGYLACKNWLLVCWWLWFDWIFACLRVPVLITTSISSCCGRTQNSLTGLSCKLAMKECVCMCVCVWCKHVILVYCYLSAPSSACVPVSDRHFHLAFEKFTPSTLHNVPLLKPGELTWSDVGGLHDIRTVLQQTLLWPTKVKQLHGFFYIYNPVWFPGL